MGVRMVVAAVFLVAFQCFVILLTVPYWKGGTVPNCITSHHPDFQDYLRNSSTEEQLTIHKYEKIHIFNNSDSELHQVLEDRCSSNYTVPKIVHYIWFSKHEFLYEHFLSLAGAYRFIVPCFILIHGDALPYGPWWERLLDNKTNLVFVHKEPHHTIYGNPVKQVEHQADIARLEVIIEYGGIYLDTDTVPLKSFDPLLNRNLTMDRIDASHISVGVIIGTKDNTFLKIWKLTYRTFNDHSWVGHSTCMAHKISTIVPELVHVLNGVLVKPDGFGWHTTTEGNFTWGIDQFSIHIYARFFKRHNFTLTEMKESNLVLANISRHVLDE